jgi:hypothetical protein
VAIAETASNHDDNEMPLGTAVVVICGEEVMKLAKVNKSLLRRVRALSGFCTGLLSLNPLRALRTHPPTPLVCLFDASAAGTAAALLRQSFSQLISPDNIERRGGLFLSRKRASKEGQARGQVKEEVPASLSLERL